MSDEQTPEPAADEIVVEAAAVTDGAYTLFVADFDDTETAWAAYEALKSIEDGRTVEIESVIVVKRDADGKIEVQKGHRSQHSTRAGLGRRRRRGAGRALPAVDHR